MVMIGISAVYQECLASACYGLNRTFRSVPRVEKTNTVWYRGKLAPSSIPILPFLAKGGPRKYLQGSQTVQNSERRRGPPIGKMDLW
jgi:hypothetical protein